MHLRFTKVNNNIMVDLAGKPMQTLNLLLDEWLIFIDIHEFIQRIYNHEIEEMSYNNMIIQKTSNNFLKIYNVGLSDMPEFDLLIKDSELIKLAKTYFEYLLIPWTKMSIEYEESQYNLYVDDELRKPSQENYTRLI